MVVEWTSSGLGQLAAGSAVWYRVVTKAHPDAPWEKGQLSAVNDEMVQVQTLGRGSKVITLPLKDVEPANPDMLAKVPDLTSLSHLNEPSLLHTLHNRYNEDVIYTKAGPVLIALNPCKRLPLYEASVVNEYRQVHSDLDAQQKMPHIFLNAGKAFRDMVDNQQVPLSSSVHAHA
jgi:myosin V